MRNNPIELIKEQVLENLTNRLTQAGLMFRVFGRAKSVRSLEHKMMIKGEKYRNGAKIQDMIGVRIVLYFSEDVDALEMFLCDNNLVDRSVDEPDVCTFSPQRLNLVKRLDENLIADFRKALPAQYAQYIDDTYEIQVRTVFSEGWHEVEHDMRYKCKEDWLGCNSYSRQLNGIIATLETAQWSMGAIFREMSQQNLQQGNYRAMLRNQLLIRLANDDFSTKVTRYLNEHPDIAKQVHQTDRLVLVLTLLNLEQPVPLTYDNVLFVINRIDLLDEGLSLLEAEANHLPRL